MLPLWMSDAVVLVRYRSLMRNRSNYTQGFVTNPESGASANSDLDANLRTISILTTFLETSPASKAGPGKGGGRGTGHPLRLLFFLRPNEIRTEQSLSARTHVEHD
jgi:hypothetical protein